MINTSNVIGLMNLLKNLSKNIIFAIIFLFGILYAKNSKQSRVDSLTVITVDSTSAGFVSDGKTNNAEAIQSAIDSLKKLGGGTLRFVNGKYLSGPFILTASNFTLEIDSSAAILASQNVHDYYLPGADTTKAPSKLQNFISADGISNLTLTGNGTIDGQGKPWWDTVRIAKSKKISLPLRPRLIQISHSKHILVTKIHLKNAPMFHLCFAYCYDINVNHIDIKAPANSPNTDGIDPGESHHIRISYCIINNGDDDIAVGASHFDPNWSGAASTDIIITHCKFYHGHGCSIGSYTVGGVDSMLVDSCTFDSTDNGFRIKSNRGRSGKIRNITYRNIKMNHVKNPIYLTAYYPHIPSQSDPKQSITSLTPYYHDITFQNIQSINSPYAGVIVGVPELLLNNIHLKNVSISAKQGLVIRNAVVDTTQVTINSTSTSAFIMEVNGYLNPLTSVVDKNVAKINSFSLSQNYPNPFNPGTEIEYSIPQQEYVTLKVFDITGKEIYTLVNREEPAGKHLVNFVAKDLASGIYFYRLNAGSYTAIHKMILLK